MTWFDLVSNLPQWALFIVVMTFLVGKYVLPSVKRRMNGTSHPKPPPDFTHADIMGVVEQLDKRLDRVEAGLDGLGKICERHTTALERIEEQLRKEAG